MKVSVRVQEVLLPLSLPPSSRGSLTLKWLLFSPSKLNTKSPPEKTSLGGQKLQGGKNFKAGKFRCPLKRLRGGQEETASEAEEG